MELSDILEGAKKFLEEANSAYNADDTGACSRNLIWLRKLIEDEVPEEAGAVDS